MHLCCECGMAEIDDDEIMCDDCRLYWEIEEAAGHLGSMEASDETTE